MSIVLGGIGWTVNDLKTCTYNEMMLAFRSYRLRNKEEWERVRMVCAYTLSPWQGKGKRLRFSDIHVPTDDEFKRKKKVLNIEDKKTREEQYELFARIIRKTKRSGENAKPIL